MNARLAVVVPTRNRPDELAALLANLERQTRAPDMVVVVDGSDPALRPRIEAIVGASKLPCSYRHHWPPSAAAQRNAGLSHVLLNADLVALIDDDVTLDPAAFASACAAIATTGPDFIGFGLNPTDEDSHRGYGMVKRSSLAKALGLYSEKIGAVTRSGWHTRLVHVEQATEVEWLLSGAVIWRADAIRDIRFDEFFVQYSYLEDLEFSLQARARGRFLVLSSATYLHVPAPGGRNSRFWFGRIEIRNRHYIVRKHHLSLPLFWTGAAIRAAMTLVAGLTGNRAEFGRFSGNIAEMARLVVQR